MAGADADKQSQLLAEIEEFSRAGPRPNTEPAKPELRRETLAFPDLNKPPPVSDQARAAAVARQTVTGGGGMSAAEATGLLARLKQQAQAVQQDASQQGVQADMRAQLLSASIGAAFHYLDDLVKQLNIIKPPIPKEFVFPGNIMFDGMGWIEGAADFRMVPTATEDRRYESLTVRFRIAAPRQIAVERDAVGVEPFRKLLHDFGIVFTMAEKKNARNQVERASFSFPCEVKAGFLIKADYETGDLILRTRNIDRFGMMEFRLQAEQLDQNTLDELTKLFLGEKSNFLRAFRRTA